MDSKSSKSLSVSSSVGSTVASLSKKRSREESFDEEGRDDLNTKSLSLSEDDDNVSTSGLSLGGFSLGSLGEYCRIGLWSFVCLSFFVTNSHIRLASFLTSL